MRKSAAGADSSNIVSNSRARRTFGMADFPALSTGPSLSKTSGKGVGRGGAPGLSQSTWSWLGLGFVVWCFCGALNPLSAQPIPNRKYGQEDKFRQLEEILPTPNLYRTAAGEPGPGYWQQKVDYVIDVELDDAEQMIRGVERIVYHNQSPHTLRYLWLQLDANLFSPESDGNKLSSPSLGDSRMSTAAMKSFMARQAFDGGVKIGHVRDAAGADLAYTVVQTMMRVDLTQPLLPGEQTELDIRWEYAINDARLLRARTGYEHFEEDDNYIYEIAQWFPRLAAYSDATGWQHKQYLGEGEFTLELGDYLVRITVPADHVVGATGELINPEAVLTPEQRERLESAWQAERPVFVVTPEEAMANQAHKESVGTKTWVFQARRVRDFAFASSRKFIWDAWGHSVEGNRVMAMSLYPNEAEPLWSLYSTQSIVHTLNVYSRYTFPYPYPVAYSVNGPVGGMEYPMICFNGPRPLPDGTYSAATKYALISVIIHEVGHNYFPMIVNSDERQWTWMDEGLNTFLQYLAEQEWEEGYPSRRGEPEAIVPYMRSDYQVPVMTNSESILQFGPNAYAKPATALNILRETILGRELFDFAFKEYARRWQFKRPMPADFFRTMEDASGVDLDWFWRGWFYTTDHVDMAIDRVELFLLDEGDPDAAAERVRQEKTERRATLSEQRNADLEKRVDQYPYLKDFYNQYDPGEVTDQQRAAHRRFVESLSDEERQWLESHQHFYRVQIKNVGGLVMPVILLVTFEDGSERLIRLPAEIWRKDAASCSTVILASQPIQSFELDPYRETADIDRNNNHFPPRIEPTRFQLFQSRRQMGGENPMQRQRAAEQRGGRRRGGAAAESAEDGTESDTQPEAGKPPEEAEAETPPVAVPAGSEAG